MSVRGRARSAGAQIALRACLEEATAEAAAGRADRAIAAYRQAIALAPARSDLRYNLGVLLAGQDDFAAAERAFLDAQSLRPDWAALPLALGHLCYRQRRYAEAEVHFERAVALAPDSVEALGNLALALSARWRYDLALPFLRRARALAPADEEVWFALRGVLLTLDRDEDALQDFLAFEREAKPSARLVATGAMVAMLEGDRERQARYLPQALAWPYEPKDAALVAALMAQAPVCRRATGGHPRALSHVQPPAAGQSRRAAASRVARATARRPVARGLPLGRFPRSRHGAAVAFGFRAARSRHG